ncbi:MAG: ribosomal protein L7/L12 [Acidobacteriota bacterium]
MSDYLTSDQTEKIREELESQNKIQAIKMCREFTGWGLKESKDYVDKMVDEMIERDPEKYGHLSSARSGCFGLIAITPFCAGIIYLLLK